MSGPRVVPASPRFAAPPAGDVLLAPLGPLTAVFLRRSGETHLIVDPAPQVMAALEAGPADAAALAVRLAAAYDLAMDEEPAGTADPAVIETMIATTLTELAGLGLVHRLDG